MGRTSARMLALPLLLAAGDGRAEPRIDYPQTRIMATAEQVEGRAIADPYRWLEGSLVADPGVRAWAEAQDALTEHYLARSPMRNRIQDRLTALWNFEKLATPRRRGNRLFYERNSGLQNQSVLFVEEAGRRRVLVDPNALAPDGSTVVKNWLVSPSGDKLLYAVQRHGGDWRQLHVVDVASGRDDDLKLEGIRTPAFAWAPDGSGIYYTRYPSTDQNGTAAVAASAIYLHRLGTAQAADRKIYELSDPKLLLWPRPTDDGRWLIADIATTDGARNDSLVFDLARGDAPPVPLIRGFKASYRYVGSSGDRLIYWTTDGAANGRVVSLDPRKGDVQQAVQIVPAAAHPIQQVVLAGDELAVRYLEGVQARIRRFSLAGSDLGMIPLPPLSMVGTMEGRPEQRELFYTVSSMVRPATVYRLDLATGQTTVLEKPKTTWNPDDYVVRQIMAVSRDGTRIPVTLAHRRTVRARYPLPTMMMVYGGWGISVDLNFYESRFGWMDLGGVFAIAHIRGGGEFGERWHQAAMKEGHLRGIEDMAAAAEALHREGIATPRQTIAYGSSNGGMMVTATLNKRPDLFGAAIARVPVTDLVRFTNFTAGKTWVGEIGDPSEPDELAGLLKWSPLHNIAPGRRYPATLVATADSDDRVVPMHSFKYVAALQAADPDGEVHLLRLERNAGHGEGKSQGQLIKEFTDLWTFAALETGLDVQ